MSPACATVVLTCDRFAVDVDRCFRRAGRSRQDRRRRGASGRNVGADRPARGPEGLLQTRPRVDGRAAIRRESCCRTGGSAHLIAARRRAPLRCACAADLQNIGATCRRTAQFSFREAQVLAGAAAGKREPSIRDFRGAHRVGAPHVPDHVNRQTRGSVPNFEPGRAIHSAVAKARHDCGASQLIAGSARKYLKIVANFLAKLARQAGPGVRHTRRDFSSFLFCCYNPNVCIR
jgi:hypothetical protein